MKLLRDFFFLGPLRHLAAARRRRAPDVYAVTVPAPLAVSRHNVVALRRLVGDSPIDAGPRLEGATPSFARAVNQ